MLDFQQIKADYPIATIAEYIKQRTQNIKGCEHDWYLEFSEKWFCKLNPDNTWEQHTYRCTKCCDYKKISSKEE